MLFLLIFVWIAKSCIEPTATTCHLLRAGDTGVRLKKGPEGCKICELCPNLQCGDGSIEGGNTGCERKIDSKTECELCECKGEGCPELSATRCGWNADPCAQNHLKDTEFSGCPTCACGGCKEGSTLAQCRTDVPNCATSYETDTQGCFGKPCKCRPKPTCPTEEAFARDCKKTCVFGFLKVDGCLKCECVCPDPSRCPVSCPFKLKSESIKIGKDNSGLSAADITKTCVACNHDSCDTSCKLDCGLKGYKFDATTGTRKCECNTEMYSSCNVKCTEAQVKTCMEKDPPQKLALDEKGCPKSGCNCRAPVCPSVTEFEKLCPWDCESGMDLNAEGCKRCFCKLPPKDLAGNACFDPVKSCPNKCKYKFKIDPTTRCPSKNCECNACPRSKFCKYGTSDADYCECRQYRPPEIKCPMKCKNVDSTKVACKKGFVLDSNNCPKVDSDGNCECVKFDENNVKDRCLVDKTKCPLREVCLYGLKWDKEAKCPICECRKGPIFTLSGDRKKLKSTYPPCDLYCKNNAYELKDEELPNGKVVSVPICKCREAPTVVNDDCDEVDVENSDCTMGYEQRPDGCLEKDSDDSTKPKCAYDNNGETALNSIQAEYQAGENPVTGAGGISVLVGSLLLVVLGILL